MYTYPLTRLVRIKGAEVQFYDGQYFDEVVKILNEKEFKNVENSSDGIIVTYESEYSIEGVNTWLTINLDDLVSDVKHTKAKY